MYVFNAKFQKEEFSDGDVMIHNMETQTVHILNPTSAIVLELLLRQEPPEALASFLARFSGDPSAPEAETLESDFKAAMEALAEKQILLPRQP